ncbi:hypothetical protein PVK06_011529 [Gossypium arboreum]|uniref:Uncharacterized protein n=1 Tax=Gossypium arboreum TaxID=29729 RepID=A0ABR0Q9V9_GOSAR|nr:hypothetical protein PVK06_011529 [Gossypium arboreum]
MSKDDERQQSLPSDLEFVSNKARNYNAIGSGSGHPEFQSTYSDQGILCIGFLKHSCQQKVITREQAVQDLEANIVKVSQL